MYTMQTEQVLLGTSVRESPVGEKDHTVSLIDLKCHSALGYEK